ncbi:DUF397 domain-containing protein [Streptomyces sp. TRM64462]|uniref:DUF397 domain-containing protein n=1 Tax=Streptomyces sp. TRM64462 TaxID=2741726 RepID=UPI0015861BBE|nr:DUF397 domain-containing protein [Streptomyces sp. TRM64462]
MPDVDSPFRKSSYSDQQGDCLEVAPAGDQRRAVRDSKNPERGLLRFSSRSWGVFVGGLKGEWGERAEVARA